MNNKKTILFFLLLAIHLLSFILSQVSVEAPSELAEKIDPNGKGSKF